jgi:hypothetical protein
MHVVFAYMSVKLFSTQLVGAKDEVVQGCCVDVLGDLEHPPAMRTYPAHEIRFVNEMHLALGGRHARGLYTWSSVGSHAEIWAVFNFAHVTYPDGLPLGCAALCSA